MVINYTVTLKVRIFSGLREITLYTHIDVINYTVTLKIRIFYGKREIPLYIYLNNNTLGKNI